MNFFCKRWRDVSHLSWEDTKFLNFTTSVQKSTDLYRLPSELRTNRVIGRILKKCGHYLRRLRLGYPCQFDILQIVEKHCDNLIRLEVNFYDRKDCVKYFPRIEKLKYYQMGALRFFPREALQVLPSESLTEIHLWTYTTDTLGYALGSLPRIASTTFENLRNLSAISLHGFDLKPDVMDVICQKTNLQYLSLKCSRLRAGLSCLTQLKPLRSLDLTAVEGINDLFLGELADNCKNLGHLNLTLCCGVTDRGITSLRNLPLLQQLVLNHVDSVTDAPLSALHTLKKLECLLCKRVKDEGIVTLMKNAISLEYLNVVFSGVTRRVLDEAHKISHKTDNFGLVLIINDHSQAPEGHYEYPCLAVNFTERTHVYLEFSISR
ncbi:uncharacterized protein [Fopius arisanus]|uniref:Uncharacterized protein isoform X2 n=2 Tax=Fopius arisanus TaxID=64838 RepID=A0A9R1U5U0_9HYME|nr:PREDICTED: uncharacterized protein LOC105269587 isoform X2 [Fopius arisanus]